MTSAKGLLAQLAKIEAQSQPHSFVLWIDDNGDLLPGQKVIPGRSYVLGPETCATTEEWQAKYGRPDAEPDFPRHPP